MSFYIFYVHRRKTIPLPVRDARAPPKPTKAKRTRRKTTKKPTIAEKLPVEKCEAGTQTEHVMDNVLPNTNSIHDGPSRSYTSQRAVSKPTEDIENSETAKSEDAVMDDVSPNTNSVHAGPSRSDKIGQRVVSKYVCRLCGEDLLRKSQLEINMREYCKKRTEKLEPKFNSVCKKKFTYDRLRMHLNQFWSENDGKVQVPRKTSGHLPHDKKQHQAWPAVLTSATKNDHDTWNVYISRFRH